MLLLPFLKEENIVRQNDLAENTIMLSYIKESLLNAHRFPQWNPYINQGVPIVADPLNPFLNPLVSLPFLIFPFQLSFKIIYLISALLSIITMYYLCKKMRMDKNIAILISLTYVSSGYFASRIIAAHNCFIYTYPLLPLLILSLLKISSFKSLIWTTITAVILTLITFSGDFYSLQYAFIMILTIKIYFLVKERKFSSQFFLLILLFFLFSSAKLLPLLETKDFLAKNIEPFVGSQNLISIVYYLFLPIKPLFQISGLKEFITTDFAWWEKIAFIGPLPLFTFFFLIWHYKKIRFQHKHLLLLFLFVLLLIAMPALSINPLNIAIKNIKFLQIFHVPSRVFSFIIVILLLIMGHVLHKINQKLTAKKKKIIYFILVANLFLTVLFFEMILIKKPLPPSNSDYEILLSELKNKDHSVYYTGYLISQTPIQRNKALEDYQKTIQNYPFLIKDSPAQHYVEYNFNSENKYQDIIPKYFLAEKNANIPPFVKNYNLKNSFSNSLVYESKNYTPYALIQEKNSSKLINDQQKAEIENIQINIDEIKLKIKTTQNNLKLTLLESYYPGWQVFVDKKRAALMPNRFLSTEIKKDTHFYSFRFSSLIFKIGFIISLLSFSFWLIFISLRFSFPKIIKNFLTNIINLIIF